MEDLFDSLFSSDKQIFLRFLNTYMYFLLKLSWKELNSGQYCGEIEILQNLADLLWDHAKSDLRSEKKANLDRFRKQESKT